LIRKAEKANEPEEKPKRKEEP